MLHGKSLKWISSSNASPNQDKKTFSTGSQLSLGIVSPHLLIWKNSDLSDRISKSMLPPDSRTGTTNSPPKIKSCHSIGRNLIKCHSRNSSSSDVSDQTELQSPSVNLLETCYLRVTNSWKWIPNWHSLMCWAHLWMMVTAPLPYSLFFPQGLIQLRKSKRLLNNKRSKEERTSSHWPSEKVRTR
jgi:hypothetical protein